MNDKLHTAPIGHQIRQLRRERGWSLAELARRAGTSGPTLHRYENGWDRFELQTLKRIAGALGAHVEVRLVAAASPGARARRPTRRGLLARIKPLFWDRDLKLSDLDQHPIWVMERVLTSGDQIQVQVARSYFGDDVLRRAIARRGVDARTRRYWRVILDEEPRASQGS